MMMKKTTTQNFRKAFKTWQTKGGIQSKKNKKNDENSAFGVFGRPSAHGGSPLTICGLEPSAQ